MFEAAVDSVTCKLQVLRELDAEAGVEAATPAAPSGRMSFGAAAAAAPSGQVNKCSEHCCFHPEELLYLPICNFLEGP